MWGSEVSVGSFVSLLLPAALGILAVFSSCAADGRRQPRDSSSCPVRWVGAWTVTPPLCSVCFCQVASCSGPALGHALCCSALWRREVILALFAPRGAQGKGWLPGQTRDFMRQGRGPWPWVETASALALSNTLDLEAREAEWGADPGPRCRQVTARLVLVSISGRNPFLDLKSFVSGDCNEK